ncbi:MAG: ribosome maturation factor RimP [Bacilli bacterium]|nr:ribosome maturation factor RimP [Bacilli bacterium]
MELKEKIFNKLNEIGYELDSLNIVHHDGQKVLEIVVDRVKSIDMNDIVEVTNYISNYLDELNPFDDPYTLDISSLGAEKPLKIERLNEYINQYVHVHLINPIKGENIYEGILESLNDETISLSYRIKTRINHVDIQKSNISKIRLAIKF